jgi:L-arabinokinase
VSAPDPADFIYSEYLTALRKFEFRQLVWQIAQDYSAAALLLRLPGYVPMPAFTAIEDVPLVVRHARKTPQQVCWDSGTALPSAATFVVYATSVYNPSLSC